MIKKGKKIFLSPIIILPIFFILFSRISFCVESPEELFLKANALYRENKFEDSVKIYESLLTQFPKDPVLLYNLGNSYAQIGKKGEAILMWERAGRILPRDSDLQENLNKLTPVVNRREMFLLFKPFAYLKNALSLNEWSILLSVLWFLLLIAFGLRILLKHSGGRKIFSFLSYSFGILLVIFLCFWVVKFYQQEIRVELILIEDGIVARSGPGEDFAQSILQPLPQGTKVIRIVGPDQNWVRVRLLDGSAGGWIPQASTRQI